LEVRQVGRADPALPETHRPETVQVPPVLQVFLQKRPPVAPHEEALINLSLMIKMMTIRSNLSNRFLDRFSFRQEKD